MTLQYFTSGIRTAGPPTEEQLAKINVRLDDPLTKDEVFVFRSVASDRSYDSYHSRMSDSSLRNYAKDYSDGRAFMNGHKVEGQRPTGRTFDGHFDETTGEVVVDTYVQRGIKINDVANDDFISAVRGGTIQDVSIRFSGGDEICEICDNKLASKRCEHVPGAEYTVKDKTVKATYRIENAHAAELSDVYKGSNPGAGILRKIRLMNKRGLLSDKQKQLLSRELHLDIRSICDISGGELTKFNFEYEEDDDPNDADDNFGANPVDNLTPGQKTAISTNSTLYGRGTILEKTEFEGLIKVYTRQLEEHAVDLDPDYIREVRDCIAKWRKEEEAEPPFMKKKNDEQNEDEKKEKEKGEPRYLKPRAGATLDSFIRALGKGDGKEPLAMFNASEMEPGKGHTAGMVMEGTNAPYADAASQMMQEIDGEDIPSEADIIKGLTELNVPTLQINPSGAMFLLAGGTGVGGGGGNEGIGVGGDMLLVNGRSEKAFKQDVRVKPSKDGERPIVFEPLAFRLDDANNVRALVSAAIDGTRYRRFLQKDLVRFGMIKDGKRFDKDFHLELAENMNTERLEKYVENMKKSAADHLRTNPNENHTVDDFSIVQSRQTLAGTSTVEVANKDGGNGQRAYDPWENDRLYQS